MRKDNATPRPERDTDAGLSCRADHRKRDQSIEADRGDYDGDASQNHGKKREDSLSRKRLIDPSPDGCDLSRRNSRIDGVDRALDLHGGLKRIAGASRLQENDRRISIRQFHGNIKNRLHLLSYTAVLRVSRNSHNAN